MKKWLGLFLCFWAFLINEALAAEAGSNQDMLQMGEVVVTATRSETSQKHIGGSSVTVLTADEIEKTQQPTVKDVLKTVPGLDVTSTGGLGTQAHVRIRGADSKNTLVMVDGVMLNDPSNTQRDADLSGLTVDNIERIEVVRGPLSVLYGSNAAAGVVNIITQKGKGKPSFNFGLEGGSYNTYKVYGGSSGELLSKKLQYSASLSRTDTDGFSNANDDNDDIPHDGNTSEDDGWENTTFSGKIGYNINDDFDIGATLRYMDSEVEIDDWRFGYGYAGDRFDSFLYTPNPDGSKKQHDENEQLISKVTVHNSFFDDFLNSNLYYQFGQTKRDSYNATGDKAYAYDGDHYETGWQGTLNFQDVDILSFGGSYYNEGMKDLLKKYDDANTKSAWLQNQAFLFNGLDLVAGLRFDDHNKFGSKVTYRVAPSYYIESTRTTLKASYGTGFRAPSLYELYSNYGNEDLDPEKSEGWDVGFEQSLFTDKIRFGLTYFAFNFEDRIGWDYSRIIPGNTWPGGYNQLQGTTKSKGVESFVQWIPITDLKLNLNYTYTDTQDPDGERLVRVPYNKVNFDATYNLLKNWSAYLEIKWVDDRKAISTAKDKNGNAVDTLDPYTVVNLSSRYDINDHLQIYGRIENLFDKQYEEAWSYATPGQSAYAGFKLTF